jgi:hypothetical protein
MQEKIEKIRLELLLRRLEKLRKVASLEVKQRVIDELNTSLADLAGTAEEREHFKASLAKFARE